jgi:hypothetical protein
MFQKRLGKFVIIGMALCVATLVSQAKPVSAATDYSNSDMMDDQTFTNLGAMTPGIASPTSDQIASQVQAFLSGQSVKMANGTVALLSGGSSCLKSYQDTEPSYNGTSWSYGSDVSASKIIGDAAVQWGINPEVIISTLEKEESLISGTSCDAWRYQSAMGYGCPDSGGCSSTYAGFTRQVLWGSWQLKFNEQRAYGLTSWDGDGDVVYTGYMTQGTFSRCENTTNCPATTFNGNATLDGQTIHVANGATASLYSYTPHLNQSFPGIFEEWFGSVMVPTYSWESTGQYAYTDATKTVGEATTGMLPGQQVYVGVQALNTGNTTWTNSGPTPVMLGTSSPLDRISAFCDNWGYGCNRPAAMQQASVAPGQVATFEFWMKAPSTPGVYNEHFNLIETGTTWFPDQGLNFYMTVVPAVYNWQPTGQFAYTDSTMTTGAGTTGMHPGNLVYVGFTARNTGNVTWTNSGSNPIDAGTTSPLDRNSAFCDSWGWGCNRPARLLQASVAPGQVGTFEYYMKAPPQTGTYIEHFSLVAEGITWMNDPGLNFYLTVTPAVYSWQPVGQFAYTDSTTTTGAATTGMHPGNVVYVGFQAKNTGNVTWYNNGSNPVDAGTTDPQDRNSAFCDSWGWGCNRPARLLQASVAPGQVGTFEYYMKAPPQTGTYIEHFSLVAEGATWMDDPGLNFYMTVTP